MSLIPADNVFALGAILFCVAWLAFLIDTKPIGKKRPVLFGRWVYPCCCPIPG